MCNHEQLIGYLYDDLAPNERIAFEAHLAACAACRSEAQSLRATRQQLAAWAPPEPAFNFRVVRNGAPPAAPVRRFAAVPQWALAAAASLFVLAGAAALANLEVQYGPEGLRVRTGWGVTAAPAASAEVAQADGPAVVSPVALPAAAGSAPSKDLEAEIAALRERLDRLQEQAAAGPVAVRASAEGEPGVTTAQLRRILNDLEERHRTELALQIRHLWADINAVRQADFVRIQQVVAPELQRQQRSIETQQRTLDSLMYRTTQYK